MQDPIDDPPDAWEPTEFAFARLRFRSPRDAYSAASPAGAPIPTNPNASS